MRLSRWSLPCWLLLAMNPALCQDKTAWLSGEWQPDTEQNDQLFEEAQKKFKKAAQEAIRERRESGEAGESRGGGMGRGGGGMGGGGMGGMGRGGSGMGRGGGGRPRGGRGDGEPPSFSLAGMLPAELAFAAPTDGSLILQRTRDAVLFGRGNSDAVVFLPAVGKTGLGNGIQAALREENGQLMLQADMLSGQRAYYRYTETPEGLRVDISVDGRFPGGSVEVSRIYRRIRVDVGAPEKATP